MKMSETRGQILQRHKLELRNLMKVKVGKKDTKKKEEIQKLKEEMELRHQMELAFLEAQDSEVENEETSIDQPTEVAPESSSIYVFKEKKKTKAQIRKENKEKAEQLEKERIEKELEGKVSKKVQEEIVLSEKLKQLNLTIHDIKADGDCLFNSILHQLAANCHEKSELSLQGIRKMCCDEMELHSENYQPFIDLEAVQESSFESYVGKMRLQGTWGGHLELLALATSLNAPIRVIHAHSDVEVGTEFSGKELLLSYHQHQFGLGEHYNSLIKS
eukprot:GCRY01002863.1.p1 GENE.GCRY01002863.1~~GCRY01002863.1.p1  ORF type:complete len:274 (+),score=60.75 GCRY01002863.1:293-1114(+)